MVAPIAGCGRAHLIDRGPQKRTHTPPTAGRRNRSVAGRREVESDERVASEPGDHLGMFVGGIVVEDDVDGLLRWNS
jgi:hypothetical protein